MRVFLLILSFLLTAYFVFIETIILLFAINNRHYAHYYTLCAIISLVLLLTDKRPENTKDNLGIRLLKIMTSIVLGFGVLVYACGIWLTWGMA